MLEETNDDMGAVNKRWKGWFLEDNGWIKKVLDWVGAVRVARQARNVRAISQESFTTCYIYLTKDDDVTDNEMEEDSND